MRRSPGFHRQADQQQSQHQTENQLFLLRQVAHADNYSAIIGSDNVSLERG
jgi:hypothetical protein